jgi:hypothetical protein
VELLQYAIYIAVKYAAYFGWCFAGAGLLAPARPRRLRLAALLGAGRLLLGIGAGLFIMLAALSMNNATRNAPLTYLSIYVPVRVVEWTLFHLLISTRFQGARSIGWVVGGVAVSCLADIPIGIMEGGVVPVGRPFC